ncbi:uncharacterized protein LOC126738062 isoform X2 [Anthonomus grandis grandis]|uniref:uncharacterized protein LOC126738062 isoform X2 n=1 Tax=Anthonomus grandis grandis TaxID=2921223 RepID=UPI00216532EF|nr:uncharacterized protein LOC126738062 isoform X2 [Anthonomus grandis grandis]
MAFCNKIWSLKQIHTNQLIRIDPSENCLVGRKPDAKISLKTNKASRSHGTLMINGEGNLMIMDLKSINGTYVNGHLIPVHLSYKVSAGDIISFGLKDLSACENENDKHIFFEVMENDLSLKNIETINLAEDEPENSGEISDSVQKNVTDEQGIDKSSEVIETSSSKVIESSGSKIQQEKANCNTLTDSSSKNEQKNVNINNSSINKLDSLLADLDQYIVNSDISKENDSICNTSDTHSKNKSENFQTPKSPKLLQREGIKGPNTSSMASKTELFQTPKKPPILKNKSIKIDLPSKRSFTTWHDNSVVIELSDDEEIGFSASQIFQTSQIKKEGEDENRDEVFQKIKTELAEMEFCSQEIICNQIPIDLEGEGFENTQQIFAVLQDDPKSTTTENGSKSTLGNKVDNINVRAIEPPTNNRRSPRNKILDKDSDKGFSNNNNIKNTTEKSNKRKLSIDKTPVEKKKPKTAQKTTPTFKDVQIELKRRHSTSKEPHLNKKDAVNIKEERRKKLKELASTSDVPETSSRITETNETSPELKTKESSDCGIDPLLVLNVKRRTSRLSSREKSPDATRTMKVIQSPPAQAVSSYNLRRAKSSNELKIPKKTHPREDQIQANTRHSTHITSNVEAISRLSSVDPRLQGQTNQDFKNYKQQIPQFSNIHHSTNLYGRQPNIWDVDSYKKRQPRRLSNLDDIIKIMVTWLPNWLSEQRELDISPPINNPPAKRIPKKFKDFNHYYNAFTKLILLETWQYIYSSWELASSDINRMQRRICIDHVRITNNQMIIDCAYYITKEEAKRNEFCRADDFVTFECVTFDNSNKYMQLSFGVVLNSRKKALRDDNLVSVKPNLCNGEVHSKVEFTLATRHYPNRELNRNKWPMMTVIVNVKSFMMHIRALKELQQSPLCSMIIEPKMNDFKFANCYGDVRQQLQLNAQQKTIVLEAANLCTGNRPGIYCVKGPPGTGKSTVIVNIILEILFSYYRNPRRDELKQPMILLSAPSNAAVDNLITKIVTAKRLFPDMHQFVKLVRIGPESSISKSVIGYSLSNLTEKHLPLKNIHIPEIKAAADNNNRVLETIKKYFGENYSQELKACETLVIKKCNIICTTLNSCINGRLIDCVNKGIIEFTCCIIDEATQCHEPESLLPTILGIDKFVLVGDPQQLNATIMSNDAVKLGFQNSLFSRLANNFESDPRSPIKLLTDQYRMHPEICAYPNKHFYNSKLRSFPNPPNKLPAEIRPYLVFNCEKISCSSNDYTNMDEVILIKKLLSTIFSVVDKNVNYSIGIITPYNAQKDLVQRNILDLMTDNRKILVNTVDSFQGSENDIIIISCVRHSSNSFLKNENRLNVALTRAKQALYIIGNYTLFKECKPLYDLREDAKKRKVLLDIRQDPRSIRNFQKYLLMPLSNQAVPDGSCR